MKNLLKNSLFPIVLLICIFLLSCEKDNEIIDPNNTSQDRHPVKEYTFEQINKNPKFNKAYSKVTAGIRNHKASVKYDATTLNSETPIHDTNFKIDSTTVKEITHDNYTSYTMFITRDNSQV